MRKAARLHQAFSSDVNGAEDHMIVMTTNVTMEPTNAKDEGEDAAAGSTPVCKTKRCCLQGNNLVLLVRRSKSALVTRSEALRIG